MDPAGPKPCASVQGTTLVVEDLFYNVNTRKQVRQVYSSCAAGLAICQCPTTTLLEHLLVCRPSKAAAMSYHAFWTLWAGIPYTKQMLLSAASARCDW